VQEEVSDSFDGESLDEKEVTFLAKKFKKFRKFMKFRKSESKKKHFKGAYDLLKAECTQNKDTKGRIENKT
jgi:hypothetical protein